MELIRAAHVYFDYVLKDENDNIESVSTALSDMDLSIEKGSFVCILGHNGSGKSSFAKLLNALNIPKEGSVYVAGLDTKNESEVLSIREIAGMVFQNPDNQIIANVVEEDVGFGPENIGVPTEEIIERVDKALKDVGMSEFRTKSPGKLSGGQKQRVAIAGVMAMHPECIILDEPTAMLDPSGREDVLRTIKELNREEGVTVILITHYMEEAIDADRIVIMEKGHVAKDSNGKLLDGTPKEIFSKTEDLKRLSLDVPVITGLADELKSAGLPLPDGILKEEELIEALKKIKDGSI